MSDTPPPPKTEAAPRLPISLVWLVPLAALALAAFVAYSNWNERGALIRISFVDAAGITAGETVLKYRNVNVGIVEDVGFTEALDRVEIAVRLDKEVEDFVDEEAQFWIVRPRITAGEITGLDTVLSGNYIEGFWDTDPGGLHQRFEGLSEAPVLTTAQEGISIELRSSFDAGFIENTPILFKGIEVGRIGPGRVSVNGEWVFADAIIYEPHDRLITTTTRFWDTSGFRFTLGTQGAEVDFDSISSLLSGGLTFDSLVSGGEPIEEGTVFTVYPDESAARNSVFEGSDRTSVRLTAIFPENVSGLSAGADVEWRGVRIGTVSNVTGVVDRLEFGDERVRLLATLEIRPSRIGLSGAVGREDVLDFLAARVEEGLRARLVTASIFTGGLKVELTTIEDAEPVEFDLSGEPFPQFPTIESEISDVSATAEGVFERINALPVEELLESAIAFLDNATALAADQSLRETPAELKGLIEDARAVIGSDEVQALPGQIAATVTEAQSATEDLSVILAELVEAQAAERLAAAIEAVEGMSTSATATLDTLPDLASKLSAVADKALALEIETLLAETTEVATAASDFLASDGIRTLPDEVAATVTEVQAAATDIAALTRGLVEADAATKLSRAVEDAGEAAQAATVALRDMPALAEKFGALADKANALPLETLLAEATEAVGGASDILTSEAAQAIPAEFNTAVASLSRILVELEEKDATQALIEAVTATEEAATDVSDSVAGVPELVATLNEIADTAAALPIDALVAQATRATDAAATIMESPETQALPGSLRSALADLETLLADLEEAELAARLTEALAAARDAAQSVSASTEGVPQIVARIDAIAAKAETMPLDEIGTELQGALSALNRLATNAVDEELAKSLSGALAEVETALAAFREGGLIENANATLSSARGAADSIAGAADQLPALASRLSRTLGQAERTLLTYDDRSDVNRELQSLLRDLRDAARAVESLARKIERKPNSLLLGR